MSGAFSLFEANRVWRKRHIAALSEFCRVCLVRVASKPDNLALTYVKLAVMLMVTVNDRCRLGKVFWQADICRHTIAFFDIKIYFLSHIATTVNFFDHFAI